MGSSESKSWREGDYAGPHHDVSINQPYPGSRLFRARESLTPYDFYVPFPQK